MTYFNPKVSAKWIVFIHVVIVSTMVVACSSSSSLNDAIDDFEKNFVLSLRSRGIDTATPSYCADQIPLNQSSTLYAFTSFDATANDVADIFGSEGMTIRIREASPEVIVQQYPGQPNRGWYGSIISQADGSELVMTQHGFHPTETAALEVCDWRQGSLESYSS